MTTSDPGEKCLTCELARRRDAGTAPAWDSIYRTPFWDIAHCYDTSLPGWIVLIARRHIEAIDQMTQDEAAELGRLIRLVSGVIKQHTGCAWTYVAQFAEAQGHHHVHFHIIPRMSDQPGEMRGPNIFKCLGVSEEQRVPEAAMNELGLKIRSSLNEIIGEAYEI